MIRWKVTGANRISCLIDPNSDYCCHYGKDKTIKANPKTLGVFTFDRKCDAEDFRAPKCLSWKILRVEPIGRGKKPKRIAAFLGSVDLKHFMEGHWTGTNQIPKGTICYPAVRVLD